MRKLKTWKDRIKAAKARGKFTRTDRELVYSWASCAVGEQRQKVFIPFDVFGPRDGVLYDLGLEFMHAVEDDKIKAANKYYKAIAIRVKELFNV